MPPIIGAESDSLCTVAISPRAGADKTACQNGLATIFGVTALDHYRTSQCTKATSAIAAHADIGEHGKHVLVAPYPHVIAMYDYFFSNGILWAQPDKHTDPVIPEGADATHI
jgi:hypothetical protein